MICLIKSRSAPKADLNDLQRRFLKDPVSGRLGSIASDLLRISNLSKQENIDRAAFDHVLKELKLFTEWAAVDLDLDVQKKMLALQRVLAGVRVHSHGELSVQVLFEKWSERLIQISDLAKNSSEN